MKERSSRDRQNEEKRRQGTPERRDKKPWEGPPSENVERRRGPGQGVNEPDRRAPTDRK